MEIAWEFGILDFFIIFGAIIFLILFVIIKNVTDRDRYPEVVDKKFIKGKWKKIEELFGYGKEMNFKLAVIEADKLLDYVLKEMYFTGDTMGDRLKSAIRKHPKLRQVWWAHRVRNQVVHETKFTLRYGETKRVLGLFRQALKELKAL